MTNDYRLYSNYLMHYGVKGMKWGVRRYQNYDGSYKDNSKYNYKKSESYSNENIFQRSASRRNYKQNKKYYGKKVANEIEYNIREKGSNLKDERKAHRKDFWKKKAVEYAVGTAVGVVAAGYIHSKIGSAGASLYGRINGLNVINGGFSATAALKAAKTGEAMCNKVLDPLKEVALKSVFK